MLIILLIHNSYKRCFINQEFEPQIMDRNLLMAGEDDLWNQTEV